MSKKRIALITGGYSGESVISYKSAKTIQDNLDPSKWESYWIDICKEGWFYVDEQGQKSLVDKNDFTITVSGNKIIFDAALIALHGTPGEDGKLQGYLDVIGLPYTSCDATTSAITFNKRYTVAVAAFSGIPVAKSIHIFKHSKMESSSILQQLQLPLFVKPNNGGSSLGMSKVKEAADLNQALDKAFAEDNQVLVEECIVGREFTIGVYKNKGEIIPLPITEIITQQDFFNYEAKYLGESEEVTPANVSDHVAENIKSNAVKAYRAFNCSGVVRIDFIYQKEQDAAYMLEINTVPGQSAASIIPQQVRAAGMTLTSFYSMLLESCMP
jgi:D-alanine-D-alanine ligase